MGNTTLITDWLRRRPSLPFVETDTDKIVIGSASSDPDVSESDDAIRATAAGFFMQYYYPEMWYAHYYWQRMEQDLGPDGLNLYSNPEGFTVPTTAQRQGAGRAAGSAGTLAVHGAFLYSEGQLTNLNLDEEGMPIASIAIDIGAPGDSGPLGYKKARAGHMFDRIKDKLEIIDRRIDNRPGSKYRFLVIADPDFSIRGMGINYTEFEDMYPRGFISARPPFLPVLAFWNQEAEVRGGSFGMAAPIPFGPPAQTLTFQWKKISEQLEAVKQLFTKYQTQNRYFDGQIVPAINFNDEFASLSSIISQIGKLLKLNGYNMKKMSDEDEVYIHIDENYNILGIRYFQPNISLNMQYVKAGYLPLSIREPFIYSQSVVFLSRWESIIDQAPSPKSKRYEVFINFIEAFANSSIRTYEINYCGPSHSPPATQRVEDTLVGPPSPLLTALEAGGVVTRKDDVLSVSFPELKQQNKVLRDPVNRAALLNDQLSKTEEKAEDAIKKVMSKLREIENSEEMTVVKHVLQKVGIDKLIIEAIKCITFNSSFDPNASSIISDTKDLISASSKLFKGRKPPLDFTFPALEIKLPTFDPSGGLSEMLKQMLLDALLEIAAALVEAIVELIRQLCAPDDLNGGDYGALNLNDMFNTNPSPNKDRPSSLGESTGPDTCFSAYNITDRVGRQYLTDVSEILRPAEICQLLKGNGTDIVIQAVLDYNSTYEEEVIKDNLNTSMAVTTFYACLGDMVDIDEICQTLAEESIIPNLDDLCLTEEKILSSVDLFNLKNLLDMLENGIDMDVPEFNLACPTKPDYIPNPLIERSLPQLINSMAEAVSINFYLAVDGVKVILLQVVTGGNLDAQRLLCAGPSGPGFDKPERGNKHDKGSDIMNKIADALQDMATKFDDPNAFTELLDACDPPMDIEDLFGGAGGIQGIAELAADFLRNFDWSATSQAAKDLYDMNEAMAASILPSAAYDFPKEFKGAIANLVPGLRGSRYYTECPLFYNVEGTANRKSMLIQPSIERVTYSLVDTDYDGFSDGVQQNDIRGAGGIVDTLQKKFVPGGLEPPVDQLRFYFTPPTKNNNLIGVGFLDNPIDAREALKIYYVPLAGLQMADGSRDLTEVEITGPRLGAGQPSFKSELYNYSEMQENLGSTAGPNKPYIDGPNLMNVNQVDMIRNPSISAFTAMVSHSLRWFVDNYGDDLNALQVSGIAGSAGTDTGIRALEKEENFENFEKTLKDNYYHSTQAGLTRGWIRYVLGAGRWSTKGIMGLLLTKDNSCVNDPGKVGDLMDMVGIVKDVQDEYNEASCSDDMSLEDALHKSVIFASILLFFQISVVKFYLQNISILSSFKLQELWSLDLVRNFINNTVYSSLDKFLEKNTVSSVTMGNFTGLFKNEILNWAERKIDRPDAAFNESILEALGIDENNREELLIDNNAIKYLLMWRMARSAVSVENIISTPGAESITDVFVKKIIGFDHQFTSPFHGGSLQWTPQVTGVGSIFGLDEIDPEYRFFVDSAEGIADAFGYGGFKLEPFVYWSGVKGLHPFSPPEDLDPPPGMPTNLGCAQLGGCPTLIVTVGERTDEHSNVVVAPNLKSQLVFKEEASGRASLSKLRKLGKDGPLDWQFIRPSEDFPETHVPTSWSDISFRLVDAKIKYRLVYYPPLEHNNSNSYDSEGEIIDQMTGEGPPGNKYSHIRKIYDNALDPALHAQMATNDGMPSWAASTYSGDPDTEGFDELYSDDPDTEGIDEGEFLRQNENFRLETILNRQEAFIPLSLANRTAAAPEIVTTYEGEFITVPHNPETMVRLLHEWRPSWGSWCYEYGWVGNSYHTIGTPGNGLTWREEHVAACIEPDKPGVLGTDPPQIWEWHHSAAAGCNECVGNDGPQPGGGGSGTLGGAGCADNDDPCGQWEAVPAQIPKPADTVDAIPSVLERDSDYITIGIPIMEFDGGNTDMNTLSEFSVYVGPNAHMDKLKAGDDWDKFNYFFSKVFNKDAALAALLMNNFYLTDVKFNSGIKTLFSDTVNGAANLFLIAMETPRGFGNRELQQVGIPGVQESAGAGPPLVDMRGFILKILREMPLLIFKGLAEMLDPHVFITKLIKDISGIVIDKVIDGMEMGLEIAGEADQSGILNAIDPKPEGLVEFLFCQLNNEMRKDAKDLWDEFSAEGDCAELNIGAPPFPDGIFPTFTTKGINFTGTLPGIFMAPPGPFGIIYLLLSLINVLTLEQEATEEERGDNEDAC